MNGKCSKCGHNVIETVPNAQGAAVGRIRTECAKCKKFAGWIHENQDEPKESQLAGANDASEPTAAESNTSIERPSKWLYVSKLLDTVYFPNVPGWDSPCIWMDGSNFADRKPYFRLTADVLAWIERAVELMPCNTPARIEQAQEAACIVASELWPFAEQYLALADVRRARAAGGSLPEPPRLSPLPDAWVKMKR